jgi:hypothetical protein
LKSVLLPTFGNPTMPQEKPMTAALYPALGGPSSGAAPDST